MHHPTVCILTLAFVQVIAACKPRSTAKGVSTITRIKNANLAIELLEKANHSTISEQLAGVAGGTTLQDKWEQLLVDNVAILKIEPKNVREGLVFDYWGNRFNLDFKSNLVAHQASAALLDTSFNFVIWSSGANGTNEFGNGDDVFPKN
jgi:hypothetical protein